MQDTVERWIARDPDPETRAELEALRARGDHAELARRFASRLEFGTAGLRGLLGAGPNRMNALVVRETTAGLGRYLLEHAPDARERGVLIGYDGRRGSQRFARDAATVLGALGFKVFLGDRVLPTPVCAFGVRHLGAVAGVVVTASHNPPEYNGYKVYWSNGAQIIPPHDTGIAAAVDRAAREEIPWTAEDRAPVVAVGEALIAAYLEGVAALSVEKDRRGRETFGIAYTPLHGVGAAVAEAALRQAGFAKVKTVASQREPDGNFPTVRFPNPEEDGAMDAVNALAREMGAELVLANDPDADRLAVAVPAPGGGYRMLTGNQIGVLLGADRIEHHRGERRCLVATTLVSSRMLRRIAAAHGADYFETLTGFKWIANGALDRAAERDFVFGYEEALGYTLGTLVRDKDGISAAVGFAELAAALRQKGQSVLDRLAELYRAHGVFVTAQRTLALSADAPGPGLGDKLRAAPPTAIAGQRVLAVTDLRAGERRDEHGAVTRVDFPSSDVLVYLLDDDTQVIVRPSGTEPKIKCYYEAVGPAAADIAAAEAAVTARLHALIETHQRELAAV